jgi:hypothetical protein
MGAGETELGEGLHFWNSSSACSSVRPVCMAPPMNRGRSACIFA